MRHHYVWLLWSLAFVEVWVVLFLANPRQRGAMWRTSLVTALFGVTEPLFVPRYWSPPSLFELAQRTGFDTPFRWAMRSNSSRITCASIGRCCAIPITRIPYLDSYP